jgi:hypothetical protein
MCPGNGPFSYHLEAVFSRSHKAFLSFVKKLRECQTPTFGVSDTHLLPGSVRHPPFAERRAPSYCVFQMTSGRGFAPERSVRHPPFAERRAPSFCVFEMTSGRGFAPNVRAANEWMCGTVTKAWMSGIPGQADAILRGFSVFQSPLPGDETHIPPSRRREPVGSPRERSCRPHRLPS